MQIEDRCKILWACRSVGTNIETNCHQGVIQVGNWACRTVGLFANTKSYLRCSATVEQTCLLTGELCYL